MPRRRPLYSSTLCFCLLMPVVAAAQAWVPPKGVGFASVSYQSMRMDHHLTSFGRKGSGEHHVRSHVALMGVSYGVTDRLALSAEIPLITSRYFGNDPHRHPGAKEFIDDGAYHPVWQDFRISAQYNAVREPVVLTPFFVAVLPSHHYSTFGHNTPGRNLREYQLGFNLGRQLRPFLPRAYVDLRYSYAFVQKIDHFDTDRSNVGLEAGYFVKPSLVLRVFAGVQKTHSGLEFGTGALAFLSTEHFLEHDRFWRSHYTRMGGGAVFSVSRSADVHAAFMKTLSGKNSELNTAIGIGMSWNFSRRREESAAETSLNAPGPRDQSYQKLAALSAQGLSRLASPLPSAPSR